MFIPILPNFDLPKLDVKPFNEARFRFERRDNRDFSTAVDDLRSDLLTRIRIGLSATYGPKWKGEVVYQYAHDWIFTSGKRATDEGSDIYLANATYQGEGYKATLGRQRLNIGTERLIGSLDWVNIPRAYDGLRVTAKDLDFFAMRVGLSVPLVPEARLLGMTKNWGKSGQSLLVYKHDEVTAGKTDITTLSHQISYPFHGFVLDFEGALQGGKVLGKDQEAWAWHLNAGYKLADKKTRLFVEANAASGGGNATKNRTFDNLYPTNHKFYGSMDMLAWKNMNEFAFGADHALDKKTDLKASWRTFSLRDPSDAWYGAGGAANKRPGGTFVDPTGASGTKLGDEFNLEFVHRYSPTATFAGGFGVFNPGGFVKKVGGSSDRQVWTYLQVNLKF